MAEDQVGPPETRQAGAVGGSGPPDNTPLHTMPSATPHELVDAFVLDRNPALRDRLSDTFELLYGPLDRVHDDLQAGDVLVRAAVGEGHAMVATLVDGELSEQREAQRRGWELEGTLPGKYALVTEQGSPRFMEDHYARRITDLRGDIPAGQAVLRLKIGSTPEMVRAGSTLAANTNDRAPFNGHGRTDQTRAQPTRDTSEATVQALVEDVDEYEIQGGKYSPQEKERAANHPAGLVLTSSVVGRLEQRLTARAPSPLHVSKEWTRFGSGRLGTFVTDYNDFAYFFGEVLAALGRLQDLLSAGAPEIPDFMTAQQKNALRPTTDRPEDAEKKIIYRQWRDQQAKYASAEGGVLGGLVFDVADTAQKFEEERHGFWQAAGDLKRTIAEAKHLGANKPTYDALDLSLSDALALLDPWAAAAKGVDIVVVAIQKRREYDEKMTEFARLVGVANSEVKDRFERVQDAQKSYWSALLHHKESVRDRDRAQIEARQRAALLGQQIAPRGETREHVLAEIRMPILVADAWRALAVIGPPARTELTKALGGRGIVEEASLKDLSWRAGGNPFADITQMRRAWRETNEAWAPVLTSEAVADWRSVNELWDGVFVKFNV
jgi:hypothetical protein